MSAREASVVLRKAAEILKKRHDAAPYTLVGCCYAIQLAAIYGEEAQKARDYLFAFRPTEGAPFHTFWYGVPWAHPDTEERVLCLLLASEYAKSEGH